MLEDLLKGHLSMSNVDIKIMIICCYSLLKPLLQMLNKKYLLEILVWLMKIHQPNKNQVIKTQTNRNKPRKLIYNLEKG